MIQFYKPKPTVTGSACSFYLNDEENSFFASIIKQKSWDKQKRRASFEKDDPMKKVIVKFNCKEICGFIDAIERNAELSGYHGSNQIVKFKFGPYMRDGKQLGFSFIVNKESKEDSTNKASFAIGFDSPDYDEAIFSKKVADHLGTEHTELYINDKDLLETIYKIPQIYSEPIADPSQIPTILLSQLTKSKVTVSLSGDGGDEVFGGYSRYFLGQRIVNSLGKIPFTLRHLVKVLNIFAHYIVWHS